MRLPGNAAICKNLLRTIGRTVVGAGRRGREVCRHALDRDEASSFDVETCAAADVGEPRAIEIGQA
jgi:hypothetical protein